MTLGQHDHRPRVAVDADGVTIMGRDGKPLMVPGAATCPVCRLHDHSDTRLAGHDSARFPIPMWQLTCPRCGDLEYELKSITADALAERRRILAERVKHDVPSQLVTEGEQPDECEAESGITEG